MIKKHVIWQPFFQMQETNIYVWQADWTKYKHTTKKAQEKTKKKREKQSKCTMKRTKCNVIIAISFYKNLNYVCTYAYDI